MSSKKSDLSRRDFLKNAGLSSLAMAAAPMISLRQAAADLGGGNNLKGFHFVCMSDAGIDDQGVHHRVLATGSGWFNDTTAVGGGYFLHFNNATLPPNVQFLDTGTWRAGRVLHFEQVDNPKNPFGFNLAGILEMRARLYRAGGPAAGIGASLQVVCNIPLIGAFTGLPEGYYLALDDGSLSYAPTSFPGGFPFGITSLSVPV